MFLAAESRKMTAQPPLRVSSELSTAQYYWLSKDARRFGPLFHEDKGFQGHLRSAFETSHLLQMSSISGLIGDINGKIFNLGYLNGGI